VNATWLKLKLHLLRFVADLLYSKTANAPQVVGLEVRKKPATNGWPPEMSLYSLLYGVQQVKVMELGLNCTAFLRRTKIGFVANEWDARINGWMCAGVYITGDSFIRLTGLRSSHLSTERYTWRWLAPWHYSSSSSMALMSLSIDPPRIVTTCTCLPAWPDVTAPVSAAIITHLSVVIPTGLLALISKAN